MARKTKRKAHRKKIRLGELPAQYRFFLNPYSDVRFTTSCPGCNGRTKQRKRPLAIHVNDWGMVILNYTCRFCPFCELLIAHQNDLEAHLAVLFQQRSPEVIGSDYLVVGIVLRKAWRRGLDKPLENPEMLAALSDFKDHVHYDPAQRWVFTGSNGRSSKPR